MYVDSDSVEWDLGFHCRIQFWVQVPLINRKFRDVNFSFTDLNLSNKCYTLPNAC